MKVKSDQCIGKRYLIYYCHLQIQTIQEVFCGSTADWSNSSKIY